MELAAEPLRWWVRCGLRDRFLGAISMEETWNWLGADRMHTHEKESRLDAQSRLLATDYRRICARLDLRTCFPKPPRPQADKTEIIQDRKAKEDAARRELHGGNPREKQRR